jgi:hypothetical protein
LSIGPGGLEACLIAGDGIGGELEFLGGDDADLTCLRDAPGKKSQEVCRLAKVEIGGGDVFVREHPICDDECRVGESRRNAIDGILKFTAMANDVGVTSARVIGERLDLFWLMHLFAIGRLDSKLGLGFRHRIESRLAPAAIGNAAGHNDRHLHGGVRRKEPAAAADQCPTCRKCGQNMPSRQFH